MIAIFYISILYIFFYVFILFFRIKLSEILNKVFIFVFVFALALVAFFLVPPTNYDLYRHFESILVIRFAEGSFQDVIINGKFGYSEGFVFNFVRWLFAKCVPNLQWLPFCVVSVVSSIIVYITYDWCKTNNIGNRLYLVSFAMAFAFMPFVYIYSGVRNPLAAAISGFAVYMDICKNQKKVVTILFLIIAILIHPSASLVFVLYILLMFKVSKTFMFIYGFAITSLNLIVTHLLPYTSGLIKLILQKYITYSAADQYFASITVISVTYLAIFLVAIMLIVYKKGIIEFVDCKLYNFIVLIVLFSVFNIGNYDLVLRPLYYLAPLSAPICSMLFRKKNIGKKRNNVVLLLSYVVIGLLVLINCHSINQIIAIV